MTVSVPVREGLFSVSEPPRLLGTRCATCARHHFPRADTCPYCASSTTEDVELSNTGTLWAWTTVTAPPPGYRGTVPYGFGVVELAEGLRVITRLTEPESAKLSAGQRMALELVTVFVDDDGRDVVTYAFAPREDA